MTKDSYNTWVSAQKIDIDRLQHFADTLGAINNDAFHTEQLASYICFKSGSNYYVRNGSDGTIESAATSTSSSTAINWAITQLADNGGLVGLKGLINLDDTINVNQHGVILMGDSMWAGRSSCATGEAPNHGLHLTASSDCDMIYITGKACAVQNLYLHGNGGNQASGSLIKVNCATGNADCHLSHIYAFHGKEFGVEALDTVIADHVFSEFNTLSNWYITGYYGRYTACTGTSGFADGFHVTGLHNRLIGCTASTNAGDGIEIQHDNNVVDGCVIYNNDAHGVHLYGASRNIVSNCKFIENSQGTANTYAHIKLDTDTADHSTHNSITGNDMTEGATKTKYAIEEADANQDYNKIKNNRMDAPQTAYVTLSGLNDELANLTVPFSNGTTYLDTGWEIDANAEYAGAFFTLPSDVTQILRMYIYAHSVVTEADAMRLQIDVNGGAANEAYTTHAYAGTDVPSTETNFAAGDIIYWLVTDANVLALQRFDSVQVKVQHEAAGGADCETDACFRNVFIEYV